MDMMNLISISTTNVEVTTTVASLQTGGTSTSAFGQLLAASLATDMDPESTAIITDSQEGAEDTLANLLSGLSNDELIVLMTLLDRNKNLDLEEAIMELLTAGEIKLIESEFGDLATLLNTLEMQLLNADRFLNEDKLPIKLNLFSKNDFLLVDRFSKLSENLLVEKFNQIKNTQDKLIQALNQQAKTETSENLKEMVSVLKNLLAKFEQETLGRSNQEKAEPLSKLNINQGQTVLPLQKEEASKKEEVKVESKLESRIATEVNSKEAETNRQDNSSTSNQDKNQNLQASDKARIDTTVAVEGQTSTTKFDSEVDKVRNESRLTYTNASDFQKQVEEMVVKQAKLVTKPNGIQTMIINMQPAHLGAIKLQVVSENGQITTQITADSALTKDLLENTISNLRLALVNSGVQVDRIEVQQNNINPSVQQTNSAQFSQFNQQKQNHEQEEEQNKKNKNLGRFSIEELEELAMDFIDENELDKNFSQDKEAGNMVNITV